MTGLGAGVTYARLRATDPARWHDVALAWRRWAATAGQWAAECAGHLTRLGAAWAGLAATAAAAHLSRVRGTLSVFRAVCWEADQALSEFAAALARARALLDEATAAAGRSGVVIDDRGTAHPPRRLPDPAAPLGSAYQAAGDRAATDEVAAGLTAALSVAAEADAAAAGRLTGLSRAGVCLPPPPAVAPPAPGATPADVRQWWETLTPDQRRWLAVTRAGWLGPLDGVPAAYRDLANRLRLDDQRAGLDLALAGARGDAADDLRELRDGTARLADRLADSDGPRAYLLDLELAGEGRTVLALGDPDRADHVLTHVPGMTADLVSFRGELTRAERVAGRAQQIDPAAATSAVLWLDYDAPDFVDEAASRRQAEDGAPALRRFQDGLRATGDAHLTVLGHSYGSLVVGTAATSPGLAADDVVFVGSPGVGVDRVSDLQMPKEHVWSTTSWTDVIQWTPLAPDGLLKDIATSRVPVIGPWAAFGRPEDELWHGENPSTADFGARTFPSQAESGHLGYWTPGRPALDALAHIALDRPAEVPR